MSKLFVPLLVACLMASTVAYAQFGGGGGGGGGGRRGQGGGNGGGGQAPSTATPTPPASKEPPVPTSAIPIVGVITSIDPDAGRITIAYDAVDALNLPAGTGPFPVSKNELLKKATVGEKVRFTLDSHQISSLQPFN